MDHETFQSLVKILADECKRESSKLSDFEAIFYGEAGNRAPTFIDLNLDKRESKMYIDGRKIRGYVTKYTWTQNHDDYGYGHHSGFSGAPYYTVDVTLKVDKI